MEDGTVDQLLKARAEIEEGLRRHKAAVTILFTDIVGSTAYFARYGDTAGLAMIQRHNQLAMRVFTEFQGRVIKTIGDSVMAEFPEPVLAIRAAVELQRRVLAANKELPERDRTLVRAGINTGIGFRRDNDVFGDVVNMAARVTKHTGPSQVLISTSVHQAISGGADFRCRSLGPVAFEGKTEKEEVYEVVWTDTGAYNSLRENATSALARGDIVASGSELEKFLRKDAPPAIEGMEARYEILEELGQGGMGIVYKARDRETGEMVGLKVLKPEIAADQSSMERFKNELRLARRITHKNVCRIHEFNRTGNTAYISMEYVDGETLRAVINRFGGLPLRKGMEIGRQLCAGLGEAHLQEVIHRDMKPENVMIDRAGNVKIMDFGIARAVKAGTLSTKSIVGTPAYMAPEQAEGKPVDSRADIYALGLILYEMMTGASVFNGDSAQSVALKQIRELPRPPREIEPGIPIELEAAILKCLEKSPGDRYQTVQELDAALEPGNEDAVSSAAKRSRAGLAAILMAAMGIATVVGVLYYRSALKPQEPVAKQQTTPAPVVPAPLLTAPEQAPPQPPAAEPAKPAAKHVSKPAAVGKAIPLVCEFEIKEGSITISGAGKVLFRDTLEGKKKPGGFMGMKGRFVGRVAGSFTLPPGTKEITVRVVSLAADHKQNVTVPAAQETLLVQANREKMVIQWLPASRKAR